MYNILFIPWGFDRNIEREKAFSSFSHFCTLDLYKKKKKKAEDRNVE